jgi:hypothetical protein
MTVSMGTPQVVWVAIAATNVVLSCLMDGRETKQVWWTSVVGVAIEACLLWWGGFFS